MGRIKTTWVTCYISGADLNLSKPPTLYLMPGQRLTWEHFNGPLRIRMHHGSVMEHCRFGHAVQIDVPKEEPKKGVARPHFETCSFGGSPLGVELPKPLR